jgi:predicted HTH domain antitoxin
VRACKHTQGDNASRNVALHCDVELRRIAPCYGVVRQGGFSMNILKLHARDLVEARLYDSEAEVMQEALRHLLQNRPDLRIALAVHYYQTDEEITLAKAAALAGVSIERMKDILVSRAIPLRLGPATLGEAQAEVAAMEAWGDERARYRSPVTDLRDLNDW